MNALPSALLPFAGRAELHTSRDSWLDARRGTPASPHRIGGSDVARILGVSPWGGPWDVWAERVEGEQRVFGSASERDLARGRKWEARVLEDYTEESGHELVDLAGGTLHVHHATEAWAVGSPDGIALDDDLEELVGVEAKTDRHRDGWGEHGTVIRAWDDGAEALVPPHYATQAFWYLEITGLPCWDMAVLIPRAGEFPELRIIRLMADATVQRQLLDRVGEWRERYLVQGVEPELDGSPACVHHLQRRYPGDPTKAVRDATDEESDLVTELAQVAEQEKGLEQRKRTAQAQLGALMGDTYGVRLAGDAKCLWIPTKGRETCDLDQLRSKFPQAAAACLRTGRPSRQFRLYGFK